jgi:hypothetical protein
MTEELNENVNGENENKENKKEVSKAEVMLRSLEKPLERMTVKDLREIGTEVPGVQGVHAMKKDEIISLLYEYMEVVGIPFERPEKTTKVKAPKVTLSKQELKAKAAALRAEKASLLADGDSKAIRVMRRRINRLKKMTRRATA